MKLEDLKNGMSYKNRDDEIFYIINDKVFVKADIITLRYHRELYQELEYYDEDFKWSSNKKYDIMKVYDADNKLIWEREEIDWSKIPVDTEVLVRNSQDQEWECRYFAKYENGKIYTFVYGATSWSSWGIGEPSSVIPWDEAKLVEAPKNKVTVEELQDSYDDICLKYDGSCSHCEYKESKEDCQFHWLLDNYNVSRK